MGSPLGSRATDSFTCAHLDRARVGSRKRTSLDVLRPSAKVFRAEAVFLAAVEPLCLGQTVEPRQPPGHTEDIVKQSHKTLVLWVMLILMFVAIYNLVTE